MTIQVPGWVPPWPAAGTASFVRVSSAHLKDPDWLCAEQVAKKARPEVWPADRGDFMARPAATFALGLLRDAALDLLAAPGGSVVEAAMAIQAAVQARVEAASEEWVAESVVLAIRGLGGYLRVLARLRESSELGPAVAVADVVVAEAQPDGTPLEWATWAIHHVARDASLCETHLLRLAPAAEVRLAPAELGVIARVATHGFIAAPKTAKGWASPHAPAPSQPPSPRRGRVRVVGVLDDSDRLVFDGTADDAAGLFATDVPPALGILAGGRYRPGRACAGCATRQQCPGLPARPGLLGVAGWSEATRALAPSDLTRHAVCPRQVYLARDLGMPAEPAPPSGALLRGIQVHDWLAAAHQRGVPCTADDLPAPSAEMAGGPVVANAGLATDLGWAYDEYVTNRHFLTGHVELCPLHRDDITSLTHEVPVTVWDTHANVVVSSRSDVAYQTARGELVLRETKTVSPRFVAGDEEALLAQFPQLALAVCLLADGHPTFEADNPAILAAELEVLGAAGHRLVRFDATDPQTVLAARTALADRVDRWLHDTEHRPGPHPPCETCPVARFCADRRPDQGPQIPADLLLGIAADTASPDAWTALSGAQVGAHVAALVDLDQAGPADDIPF